LAVRADLKREKRLTERKRVPERPSQRKKKGGSFIVGKSDDMRPKGKKDASPTEWERERTCRKKGKVFRERRRKFRVRKGKFQHVSANLFKTRNRLQGKLDLGKKDKGKVFGIHVSGRRNSKQMCPFRVESFIADAKKRILSTTTMK